ncbi:hypothetical protein EMPS_09414 [Entomortierella parvispora]|uniref:G domain-containing protein n=1 Tax=Entomortierella parvispora TaxID=205924 RepID=A0A9P3HI05_9FUNG|nr:hypothetical protein EMPS_09414 [Entomortierella parvispora]
MVLEDPILTSVVFVGDPGVGKSTLHNALGGKFNHGFSAVYGMAVGEPQEVPCHDRRLLLVDMPGIRDHKAPGDRMLGGSAIDRHLEKLHETLNNGQHYVVFLVIKPRLDGAIEISDLALMKYFLDSIEHGPRIGVILTQIKPAILAAANDKLRMALQRIDPDLNLVAHNHLALCRHVGMFNKEDCERVQRFVLSFEPKQVRVRRMASNELERVTRKLSILPKGTVHAQLDQEASGRDNGATRRSPHFPSPMEKSPQSHGSTKTVQRPFSFRFGDIFHRTKSSSDPTAGHIPSHPQLVDDTSPRIILIGNTGRGKSTILNALGGRFVTGYSDDRETASSTANVLLDGKQFQLVDIPGARVSEEEGYSRYFLSLYSELNNRSHLYLIFVVITTRNGRVDVFDLAMASLLHDFMETGPSVGFIFNMVGKEQMDVIQHQKYYHAVLKRFSSEERSMLESKRHLVLMDHEDEFSKDERKSVQQHVLSFTPSTVRVADRDKSLVKLEANHIQNLLHQYARCL